MRKPRISFMDDLPPPLRAKAARAWGVLFWERLWPAAWPLIAVVLAFAVSALSGLWDLLADWPRAVALVLFAAGLLAALVPLARVRLPRLTDALHRLETASGVAHRPATAYVDHLPAAAFGAAGISSQSESLWRAHLERAARSVAGLRSGWPRSRLALRDPYVLRVTLSLLLIIAAAMAGPQWRDRLLSPFHFAGTSLDARFAIDAWVTPPEYTGRPPIYLAGGTGNPAAVAANVEVPVGSELFIRLQDSSPSRLAGAELASDNPDNPVKAGEAATDTDRREFRATLNSSGPVRLEAGNGRALAAWDITVVADRAPEIALADEPKPAASGALELVYTLRDDYGVTSARAEFGAIGAPGARQTPAEEPLIAPPDFALRLPGLRPRQATARTYKDLLDHPWAGERVRLVLRAEDAAGNEGRSRPTEMILPERRFTEPLARALVELRRTLAVTPSQRQTVARTLDALTISPGGFIDDLTVYLAMRTAYWRLANRQEREELVSVVDLLWDTALRIEDGNLSLAERRLRDLQEQLEQALAENASDEEIQRLMEELRQALNDFMRELAKAAENMQPVPFNPEDLQAITPQDLARMLENIENLAREGLRDQARQLLSQLRNMLENLRMARPQPPSPGEQMMSELMRALSDLIARQQRLMDETFRQDNQPGQPGQQGDPSQTGELAQGQQDLQSRLQALMDQLRAMGMDPNQALDQAGRNMGSAAQSLQRGDTGAAVPDQRQALENLRQGAMSMAREMANQMGMGPGRIQPGMARTDPLGRAQPSRGPDLGTSVEVPDKIDAQTVQRILEELRRRLGEQGRPQIELDYLERLLRQF